LGELGYVEGQNLVIEYRSVEGRIERVPDIAAEFVRLKVDAIVTTTNPVALRVKQATTTVPIVMGTSSTPVEAGLVQSLARPGGNVTGFTADGGAESEGKRLELLREIAPGKEYPYHPGMDSMSEWPGYRSRVVSAWRKCVGGLRTSAHRYGDPFQRITDGSTRESAIPCTDMTLLYHFIWERSSKARTCTRYTVYKREESTAGRGSWGVVGLFLGPDHTRYTTRPLTCRRG
jgi:ABC transporter substrate binding protein